MTRQSADFREKAEPDDNQVIEELYEIAKPHGLRFIRALIIWPIAAWLLSVGPMPHDRSTLIGFVIAIMSMMNVTKHFAGAALFLMLALTILGPAIQPLVR